MSKLFFIKTIVLIGVVMLIFPSDLSAQRWKLRRYEVGVGFGSIQVFGDIGGTASKNNLYGLKDIQLSATKIGVVSNARYKIDPKQSVKANLNLGFGKGTDEGSRNDRGRAFSTTLIEFSGQYEYHFLPEDKQYRSAAIYNRRGMVNNYSQFGAYAFGGLGVTYAISSHANATIEEYDEYRTGGNFVPVVLAGVGIKYILDDRSFLNGEFGYRYGITDYIDGYNQILNSKFSDVYYFLSISYNYRLKTTRRNLPAFLDGKYRRYGY